MIYFLVVFVSTAALFASVVVVVLRGAGCPRFSLEDFCPEVVVFPKVSPPKGSWGGVDDAARASGCRTAM